MVSNESMDTGVFCLEEEIDGLKHYITKDKGYSLVVRPDGFFMLYKQTETDVYDWVETKLHSFKECETYIEQQK